MNRMSDRELLENIYILLVKLIQNLYSPEATANEFMLNIAADLVSNQITHGNK